MLYDFLHGIGFVFGAGAVFVVPGILIGWALWGRIREYARTPWRQPKTVKTVETIKVYADDVQFWLDRRESGTPVEKAIAGQMLDFLDYAEPVRPAPRVPRKPDLRRNFPTRRAHLEDTAAWTTNPEVREACRYELAKLDAQEIAQREAWL